MNSEQRNSLSYIVAVGISIALGSTYWISSSGLIYVVGEITYECVGGVNEDSDIAIFPVFFLAPLAVWRAINLKTEISRMELFLNLFFAFVLVFMVSTIRCGSLLDTAVHAGHMSILGAIIFFFVAVLIVAYAYISSRVSPT